MKFNIINEDCKVRPLTEVNLNRIAKGHDKDGYAILSASRGSLSDEENNIRTKQLKDKIFNKGYSFISVYGGYKEQGQNASLEKSFVAFPYDVVKNENKDFDEFKNDMTELAKEYDQDSILICEPNGNPHYIPLKSNVDVDDMEFKGIDLNNTDNMFFTAIKKWSDSSLNRKNHSWDKGSPQRYTLTYECYIDNPPSSIQVGHYRWAKRDMNHIYKELTESSSKSKAKSLFKNPTKMNYIKTFAIFTAENPNKEPLPKSQNKELNKKLSGDLGYDIEDKMEKTIKDGYWHYYKVKGKYGSVEKSFLVYNISLKDAKELCKKYAQQSFIYGTNEDGKLTFMFYANRKKSGYDYIKVDEKESFDILDDTAEDYFTQISRDFKFSIPFEVFEVDSDNMIEELEKRRKKMNFSEKFISDCIDEGMNDNIVNKYKWYARATIHERYKK